MPPVVTFAAPTFAPLELAGRKLCALVGWAEARDFVDTQVLCRVFDRSDVDPVVWTLDYAGDRVERREASALVEEQAICVEVDEYPEPICPRF